MLVAIGCDMARQCHLDTCPTGIATQREDLRAKFAGTPDQVERFALALAEDFRRELASRRRTLRWRGDRRVEAVPASDRRSRRGPPADRRRAVLAGRPRPPRRPCRADADRQPLPGVPARDAIAAAFHGQGSVSVSGLQVTTADRSLGAALTGAIERGTLRGPVTLDLHGSAGQSFGAFAGPAVELRLTGQANDYVGKGLSGGRLVIVPEPDLPVDPAGQAIAGNTVPVRGHRRVAPPRRAGRDALRGAQQRRRGGRRGDRRARLRVHDGRHGRRAGPVGANFGAGMTGGRAYLYDPSGRHLAALDTASVRGVRLSLALEDRNDGPARLAEVVRLLQEHRAAGSARAARILESRDIAGSFWLVEPVPVQVPATDAPAASTEPAVRAPQPDRNPAVPRPLPTPAAPAPTLGP